MRSWLGIWAAAEQDHWQNYRLLTAEGGAGESSSICNIELADLRVMCVSSACRCVGMGLTRDVHIGWRLYNGADDAGGAVYCKGAAQRY